FHGDTYGVTPLGPRAIVIADLVVAEQMGEHEPGVGAAFPDPAINHDVVFRGETGFGAVEVLEFGTGAEGTVVGGSFGPGHIGSTGNMAPTYGALLGVVGHMQEFPGELAGGTHINHWFAN